MYIFLRNLSLTEIFYISVTVPRMLRDFLDHNKFISLSQCATQLYFFCFLGTTECFLLAIMAYDRYLAICDPLHYTNIMTKLMCLQLSVGCLLAAMLLSLGQITFVFSLPFCGSNVIDHFFCDILPVVGLVCGDTYANEMTILMYGSLVIASPFFLVLVSYAHIISAVIRISSTAGRQKAFSTCGSHLTSVSLFYGTATVTYLRKKSSYTSGGAKGPCCRRLEEGRGHHGKRCRTCGNEGWALMLGTKAKPLSLEGHFSKVLHAECQVPLPPCSAASACGSASIAWALLQALVSPEDAAWFFHDSRQS
ncbi:olfactory receptor 10C1-like [Discoglossus pictus]